MVRDGRLGTHHGRGPVHESRRAECRLAGQARIHEGACTLARLPGIACGKLHEEVVRMLAVDERRHAIRGFAGCEEQRVTATAHEGIRAQHGAQRELVAGSEIAPGGTHAPCRRGMSSRRRAGLPASRRRRRASGGPSASSRRAGRVPWRGRRVGLPGGAGGVARHRVVAERARHRHGHVVMRMRVAPRAGRSRR